jgi:nitrate reductase NapE component
MKCPPCTGNCNQGRDCQSEEPDPPRGQSKTSDLFAVIGLELWPLVFVAIVACWAVFA